MKLKRTFASVAAASLLFGLGAAQVQAFERGANSPGVMVGNQVDGWAPVVLDDACGHGSKHAVISLTPAASVKPIAGEQGTVQGGALRFQKPIGEGGTWRVLVSATGTISVDVSCVTSYNYSSKTHTFNFEFDATETNAAGEGPFVTATAVGGQFVPGGEVVVEASDFVEGEDLNITMYSSPVALGTVKADAKGGARTTVRIPEDAAEGLHHLVVSGEQRIAVFALKVVKPATKAAPGQGGEQAKPTMPMQPGKPGNSGKAQVKAGKTGRPGLPRSGA